MADEVKIPISFEVTDLDLTKVNPKDVEKELKSKLGGIRKVMEDTMEAMDTSAISKDFSKSAGNMNKSFRETESAVISLSKALKNLDSGKGSMQTVEKAAQDVYKTFGKMSEAYSSFNDDRSTESTLTVGFRNTLSVARDLMKEMEVYSQWVEKANDDTTTSTEQWQKYQIYTESAKENLKGILSALREMVRTGDAFKPGAPAEAAKEYMHVLKSMGGKAQLGMFNRNDALFGQHGVQAPQALIDARIEMDRLEKSLALAKMNFESFARGKVDPESVKEMQLEITRITAQLEIATEKYNELYEASYGVAQATAEAATESVELETNAQGMTSGFQMSEAAMLSFTKSLNQIIVLLTDIASKGEESGEAVGEGMEKGSQKTKKTTQSTKELKEAFSSARNVMTATIMTLNQLGSVGTIIAQIIGIVQLLADAFRDAATASHSIIPIIGIFLGLSINVFGRIISLLKKVLALLKQIGLAILSVAQKVGSKLSSAIKKVASLFKSLIPSKDMLKRVKDFFGKYLLGFRSSYFLIRKIRQVVIDGLKELAASAPEFNEQMSQFSTALNQVKGSLVSAFQPIVSFVIPVLTRLLNVLAQVLTAIAKFNAVLVGQDYYYDYTAAMQDYADGIGGVGKAAKKAQKDLMGFDEINRLSAPNDPSGSGGGLGGTFTKTNLADTADAISWFAQKVKEAWANSDFTEVGQIIGDKLNSILEVFNSKETQEKVRGAAEKVAKSFATFINGFVETSDLGANLGKSIANLFNTAFDFLYTFATTVHWDSVGKFIGDGIASALENFDWHQFFDTIVAFVNGLADMISNAVKNHNWFNIGYSIGDGLVDAIMKFDAVKAGKAVSDFFMSLLKLIAGFVDRMSNKQLVEMKYLGEGMGFEYIYKDGWTILGEKVKQFFTSMDVDDIGSTAGETLGKIITGLVNFLTAADFHNVFMAFVDAFFRGMDSTMWETALRTYWDNSLYPALSDLIDWAGPKIEALLLKLWEIIKGPVFDLGKKIGSAIWDGVKEQVKDAFEKPFLMIDVDAEPEPTIPEINMYQDTQNTIEKFRQNWSTLNKDTQQYLKDYTTYFDDLEVKTASAATTQADATDKAASATETANQRVQVSGQTTSKAIQKNSQSQQQSYVETADAASRMGTSTSESMSSMETASAMAFNGIQTASTDAFSSMGTAAQGAYTDMTTTFDQSTGYFTDLWGTITEGFQVNGAVTQGIAIGMGQILNNSANKMIDAINAYAMTPLLRLESMLDKLRGVTFGGMTPFANLPKLGFAKIPHLAMGAVLPPNQPFLSVVGDQKRGTNIEAPLETIQQAVANVLNEQMEGMMAGFEAVVAAIQNKDMSVRIGDKDIYNANKAYEQRVNIMRGV